MRGVRRDCKQINFDSAPADDGFRNYMLRKIQLQRQQIGLVIPPPPLAEELYNFNCNDHDRETVLQSIASPKDNCSIDLSKSKGLKKNVRFHSNLEREYTAPTSISDVLNNLKLRHAKKKAKSCLHKMELINTPSKKIQCIKTYDEHEQLNNRIEDSNEFPSILEVLNHLKKKHDTPGSLMKFNDYNFPTSPVDFERNDLGFHANSDCSVLENLDTIYVEESNKNDSTLKGDNLRNTLPEPAKQKEAFNHPYSCQDYEVREPRPKSSFEVEMRPTKRDILKNPSNSNSNVQCTFEDNTCNGQNNNKGKKPERRPDLFFTGIVILVNGHTTPDSTALMRLLHKHGGDLEKYETNRVTHIIAECLSTAKVNIYKRKRRPTPVCRPEWITESVKERKLLPFSDYLLEDVRNKDNFNTTSVKDFFFTNDDSVQTKTSKLTTRNRSVVVVKHQSESETPRQSEVNISIIEDKYDAMRDERSTSKPSNFKTEGLLNSSSSLANYHTEKKVSTVGNDPNFLESYFNNSRLSYIGSFKQRLKKNETVTKRSQSTSSANRFILLVDMDCFFASVALRTYPQYRNKPVAIGHSGTIPLPNIGTNGRAISAARVKESSSELSTCNYIARQYGVRKGMFLGDAIKLCPELIVLPYDFRGYEEVSAIVTEQLHHYSDQFEGSVEQVSCDEAYVEVNFSSNDFLGSDLSSFLKSLAEDIRADIFKATECTASIGVGPNKLLAKLAADKVKPNASCIVHDWQMFLKGVTLRSLPGVGRIIEQKLKSHNLFTVNDIWDLGDDAEGILGEIIGSVIAQKIVRFCYGKDDRSVTPAARKTIGAECNYGVRFNGPYGVDHMLKGLANEVEKRMSVSQVRGSKLTLKVMKSIDPSKEPGKFLGHGSCNSFSKSVDIPLTRDCDIISLAGIKLYESFSMNKSFIRGMGLTVSSLKSDFINDTSSLRISPWIKESSSKSESNQILDCELSLPKTTKFNEALDDHSKPKSKVQSDINDLSPLMISPQQKDNCSKPTSNQSPACAEILLKTTKFDEGLDEKNKSKSKIQSITTSMKCGSISTYCQFNEDVQTKRNVESVIEETISPPTKDICRSPLNSSLAKRISQKRKFDQIILIPGQVSVKRMLKLASIKSGDNHLNSDHPNISLTQLHCLPLETQLQIANDDDVKILKKNPDRQSSTNYSTKRALYRKVADEKSLDSYLNQESIDQDEYVQDSVHFFLHNVLPLQNFITSNPCPSDCIVDAVLQFLCLCLHERRLDDVVIFLRTIKRVSSVWDSNIYQYLKNAVVNELYNLFGDIFDETWLDL